MDRPHAVVLGASGFIGGAIAAALRDADWAVTGKGRADLDLTSQDAAPRLARILTGESAAIVASAVTPDRNGSPDAQLQNRRMVEAVTSALQLQPCRLCLFFGTTTVYGDHPGNRVITEETPVETAKPYSEAKLAGERMLADSGVPLLVLRPTVVYGPGDTHTSYGPTAIVRAWLEGDVPLFGGGEDRRDFLFVDDLAKVTVRMLGSGVTGTFNVASGHAVSYAYLLEVLRSLGPREVTVTRRERRIPLSSVEFDISRLRAVLGNFAFTSIEEGLRRTYDHLHAAMRR